MANQTWITLANSGTASQNAAGSAYNTSTTLTDVSPGANTGGQAFTLPASYLQPNTQLRFTATGIYSTTGTPTLLLGIYYGGVAGTALAATAATTTASGVSNGTFIVSAWSRVTATVGTSATIVTIGSVLGIAATSANPTLMPATSSTGGAATVNTSTANILTLGAQWGTSSASNTLTVYQWLVEIMN